MTQTIALLEAHTLATQEFMESCKIPPDCCFIWCALLTIGQKYARCSERSAELHACSCKFMFTVYTWEFFFFFFKFRLSSWEHRRRIFSCDQAALQMVFSVCPSVRPSVRLSVCPSHLFDYVPIIGSSWNFQELLPMTNVRSMQKVKVRGQRSRSQRSQPNLTVSGL